MPVDLFSGASNLIIGLGETRTPTSLRTPAPKTDASAIPPRGQFICQWSVVSCQSQMLEHYRRQVSGAILQLTTAILLTYAKRRSCGGVGFLREWLRACRIAGGIYRRRTARMARDLLRERSRRTL